MEIRRFLTAVKQDACCGGTPWKGSSSYAVNEKVPLKAIVVLAQGSKNEIRRLEGDEAVSAFFSHVFFPSWNRLCVTEVMNSLDVLVRQVPVYFLSCLPIDIRNSLPVGLFGEKE